MVLPSRTHPVGAPDPLAVLSEVDAGVRDGVTRTDRLERAVSALCVSPIRTVMVFESDPLGVVAHLLAAASSSRVSSAESPELDGFGRGIAAALARGSAVELGSDGAVLDPGGARGPRLAALAQPVLGQRRGEVPGVLVVVLERAGELNERVKGLVGIAASMLAVLFVRDADHAGTEFLSTVSHELRTPLQAILGWAQVLSQSSAGSEAWRRGVHAIERNARVEAALVDDLLDSSRAVRGELRIASAPVGVRAVVETAIVALRPEAAEKGVTISLEVASDPGEVLGDRERLARVFQNLLSNAVKFTPTNGRVSVAADRTGNAARVRVRDSGEGIAPALLPHVFEAFWQCEGTDTRTHGGLGLGLPMVRHVVELHGGTVRAESAGAGRGATFTVEIPLLATRSVALERYRSGSSQPSSRAPSPS